MYKLTGITPTESIPNVFNKILNFLLTNCYACGKMIDIGWSCHFMWIFVDKKRGIFVRNRLFLVLVSCFVFLGVVF